MGIPDVADGGLEYYPYRLGSSGLVFRGPKRRLGTRYIAAIGGSETYGKFVPDPYPAQLEAILGLPVVNFGCMQAGAGVFAEDEAVLEACRRADVTIIQIMGAANSTNRHYSVHPRRNDRFLKASGLLRGLYPDVDFAEFNFTRHLLAGLAERSPDAFSHVVAEIQHAWVERMKLLIDRIGGQIVLVWMSLRSADDGSILIDPNFVDRHMLNGLEDDVTTIVEVVASRTARNQALDEKVFRQTETAAAAEVPGPQFHLETAIALSEALEPILEGLKSRGRPATPRVLEGSQSFSISSGTAVKRSATRP